MDAYLLGAGFSKAMHESMPMMGELGQEVIKRLELEEDTLTPFNNDVEAWLSYLAESQPWNTEDVDLTNRAKFVRASKEVTKIIQSRTPKTDELEAGRWSILLRLAGEWAVNQTPVLTFNYDMIVENSLDQFHKYNPADLYALPLTSRWAAGRVPFLSGSDPKGSIPTLYKLHGSVNWLHGGIENPHAPVVLKRATESDFVAEKHLYDDLLPMVIPPTSVKSSFYSNTALRSQWRNALQSLKKIDRLVVMGYSMPKTDLQVRTMIGLALKPGAEIVVVDRRKEAADQVGDLFSDINNIKVRGIYGEDPIGDFVAKECGHMVRRKVITKTNDVREEFLIVDGEVEYKRPSSGDYNASAKLTIKKEISKSWPSAKYLWDDNSTDLILHVSHSDYEKLPNPWKTVS